LYIILLTKLRFDQISCSGRSGTHCLCPSGTR